MAIPESVVPARRERPPEARDPNLLVRYQHAERLTHWAIAIVYIFLFLSGLALFHPFFFWIASVFGGGQLMRTLHPFCGVALVLLFYPYAGKLWRDNRLTAGDQVWLHHMFAYMNKQETKEVAETGKFNAGQKLMFWSMVVLIAVLLLTGIELWQPYFAPSFSAPVRKAAAIIHAVSAFIMFIGIGIHVYAAYWTKGSVKAMTRGTVTRAWARCHHPAWYRQVTGKEP